MKADSPCLIALAGLPASGKSALAIRLVQALIERGRPTVLLDKDCLRAALFPPHEIEYSTSQDDFVFGMLYKTAAWLLGKDRTVILDGRTFSLRHQVDDLLAFAQQAGCILKVIECTCPDEIAHQRLDSDLASSRHAAANRTYAMYLDLKFHAEPLIAPHLTLDTSQPLDQCLEKCLSFLMLQSKG